MIKRFWDAVSLLTLVYFALPLVLWASTGDSAFAWVFAGTLACHAFVKATRKIRIPTGWERVFLRPPGARNCNALNSGGSAEGRIGMPSGHVLTTAYALLACAMVLRGRGYSFTRKLLPPSQKKDFAAACLVALGVVLMAVSRVYRGCHTVPQVAAGAVLGLAAAVCVHIAILQRV